MLRLLFLIVLIHYGSADTSDDTGDDIQRPCPKYGLKCIRKYFFNHSNCKLPRKAIPDVIIRPDNVVVDCGLSNVTVQQDNLSYEGIKGNILDFYVNLNTDNVVLVVKLPKLTLSTEKTTLYFHRLGLEPLSVTDRTTGMYTDIIVTATIPNIDNLQVRNAFITMYTYDGNPQFKIGDNFYNNNITKPYVEKFLSNVPDIVQHVLQREIRFALHMFVKFHICDYKLPLRVYLQ